MESTTNFRDDNEVVAEGDFPEPTFDFTRLFTLVEFIPIVGPAFNITKALYEWMMNGRVTIEMRRLCLLAAVFCVIDFTIFLIACFGIGVSYAYLRLLDFEWTLLISLAIIGGITSTTLVLNLSLKFIGYHVTSIAAYHLEAMSAISVKLMRSAGQGVMNAETGLFQSASFVYGFKDLAFGAIVFVLELKNRLIGLIQRLAEYRVVQFGVFVFNIWFTIFRFFYRLLSGCLF